MDRSDDVSRKTLTAALVLLLLATLFSGLYASLHSGLTWDEVFEQRTLSMNANAAKGLLAGDPEGYNRLLDYKDKYYGIGFHTVAYPLQSLIASLDGERLAYDSDSALLVAKHPLVFLTFAGSALIFYLLLGPFVQEGATRLLFTAAYFLYPCLFGHALFNVKDVPFLFAYMLCTWFSLRCAAAMMRGGSMRFGRFMVLVLLTTWLIAIRIGGFIILAQYFFTFLLIWSEREGDKRRQLKCFVIKSAIFLPLLLALVIACYPLLWLYPGKIIDALLYMSRLPETHATLTLGAKLQARDLPAYYLFAWLAVKLPLLILASIVFLPVCLKRMAQEDKIRFIYIGTFFFTALFVPVYLTISHVALYNELRQVLFVLPFYFLLGFIVLHREFPKGSAFIGLFYVLLFAADDVLLNPFQYSWFNEAARFIDIDRNFETDYWGVSGRVQSRYIAAHAGDFPPAECIYAFPEHLYRPFLGPSYRCVKPLSELTPDAPRPYFLALYEHGPMGPASACEPVHVTSRRMLFSGPVTMSRIFECK